MFCWKVLAFMLATHPAPATSLETLLEERLELAREERAYLELENDQTRVLIAGMEVQTIPLQWSWRFPSPQVGIPRVDRLIPGLPEKLVTACVNCDDNTAAASLEDRIGVGDMPVDFVVVLSDGSHWLVQSEKGWSPTTGWQDAYWQWRVLWAYLRSLTNHEMGQLLISRMQPNDAQTLYWTLQPDMGVLRAAF